MRYWQVIPGVCVVGLLFVSSAAAQTRVACVGDSITEGYGLASPANDAYPAQLQSVLGSDYDVRNFGVSGTTARKQGDKPYWNQAAYTQSTTFDPNVVLIMLGTNDAKPQNWDASAFRTDYAALVAQYRALGARVLIATPPRVFGAGAFDISPSTVADVLVPLVRELAPQVEAELVDIFVVTQDRSDWFPDTVHPSRDGATALANAFATAVQNPQQTETVATSTTATETGPGAPSSDEPPSPSSAASDSSPPLETGDSPTAVTTISATTVSPTTSNTTGATSNAPSANPVPTTTPVVPSPTPPTSATPAPGTSSSAPTATTSNAPTSTEQTSSAAPVSAADSGCTVSGNNARARLTGGAALGLALAAWGLRCKRRELSRTA